MKKLVLILAVGLLIVESSNSQECQEKCVKKHSCKKENSTDVFVVPVFPVEPNGLDLRFGDGCDSLETCCQESDIVESTPREVMFGQCGIRNEDGIGYRLVGDKVESAEYGEFPWTLVILKKPDVLGTKDIYVCAASLIAPDVALTAAHCVSGNESDKYLVRAGEWETNSTKERYPTQTLNVSQVIVHENYNEKRNHNDIALLKMEEPFQAEESIQTICLPSPKFKLVDGQTCFTGAWGKDRFEDSQTQNILRRIPVPFVPHGKCQDAFRSTGLGPSFVLHQSNMCAGGEEDVDACTGDGGAPLVCAGDASRYYQAGIVSWGIGCGQKDMPGAYTDVSKFVGWIHTKMEELGSDINASKF